jgi:hypothetical protein
MISFLVLGLMGLGSDEPEDLDRFPFPPRNFAPRCKENLEGMVLVASDTPMLFDLVS